MNPNDLGQAFDHLKDYMASTRKPSDRSGQSFEEWKSSIEWLLERTVSEEECRPLFDLGMFPYAAFKKLEK